jgi:hypothetical protein
MLAAVDVVRDAKSGLSGAWGGFDADLDKPILDELTVDDADAFHSKFMTPRTMAKEC